MFFYHAISSAISFAYFPYIHHVIIISHVLYIFLLFSYMVAFHWPHGGVSVALTHTVAQLKTSVGWNWSYLLPWTVASVTCWLCRLGQHQREVGSNHGRGSPINGPLGFTLDQYRDFSNLHIGLCGKQNQPDVEVMEHIRPVRAVGLFFLYELNTHSFRTEKLSSRLKNATIPSA